MHESGEQKTVNTNVNKFLTDIRMGKSAVLRFIKVQCMECGKKFQTTKIVPECPKCGGVDVDVREE